jgi:RNA polymerase sigma factor for flagellar operon FliA
VLVQRYVHLVRYMANRLSRALPQSVELDDLVSAGVVGFLAAVEGFDASHGVDFSSYALTRIRGAMVDFIREIDPVGRVTRRRLRAVERAAVSLAQTLGRRPTDEEMGAELGMSLDAYHELMARATAAMTLSLDGVEAEGDESEPGLRARVADQSERDPLERVLDRSRAAAVAEMVSGLSQAQQLVLHLHYVEELNFREIAMVMDISESRATQHHSAAVLALRGRARAEPPAAETRA